MKTLSLLLACLLLSGCPAAPEQNAAPAAPSAEGVAVEPAPAPEPATSTVPPSTAPAPIAATLPEPTAARRVPEELLTQDGVHYGCKTNTDCEVKNVGNCCGYYPACVNKDSPTFPERVKSACAAEGSSSICGFPEIGGCQCLEGRCAPMPGPSGAQLQ